MSGIDREPFLTLAFAVSSDSERCASETFIPPNFANRTFSQQSLATALPLTDGYCISHKWPLYPSEIAALKRLRPQHCLQR